MRSAKHSKPKRRPPAKASRLKSERVQQPAAARSTAKARRLSPQAVERHPIVAAVRARLGPHPGPSLSLLDLLGDQAEEQWLASGEKLSLALREVPLWQEGDGGRLLCLEAACADPARALWFLAGVAMLAPMLGKSPRIWHEGAVVGLEVALRQRGRLAQLEKTFAYAVLAILPPLRAEGSVGG